MKTYELKYLKKGDFFKRIRNGAPSKKVYLKGDYDKSEKAFLCTNYEDINDYIFLKPKTAVFIDFEY
jgi:hypothetical protein